MEKSQIQVPDSHEIPVEVADSEHSKILVFWNLETDQLKVERYARCPQADWQPHKVCGKDLILTETQCEAVLYLPGSYRISMIDNSALPDRIRYEEIVATARTVELYFAEKRACCCE